MKVFPRKVVASVLTNITLYCLTSEENIKSITWYYNKTEEVIGSGLVLTLEDAAVEQSGTYTCLVIRKSGESASNISTVIIKSKCRFVQHRICIYMIMYVYSIIMATKHLLSWLICNESHKMHPFNDVANAYSPTCLVPTPSLIGGLYHTLNCLTECTVNLLSKYII